MKDKTNYIDSTEFYNEIKKFRENGIASEKLGQMILDLTAHILKSSSFSRYPVEQKEDMKSYAIECCMKGLSKFDLSRDPKTAFSYFTRVTFNAYLLVIMKNYKQENLKKKLMKTCLMNPDYIIDENTRARRLHEIEQFEREMLSKRKKKAKKAASK